ncbi:hypothetical protein NDU88_004620, partial [Pleurodeles waltl]
TLRPNSAGRAFSTVYGLRTLREAKGTHLCGFADLEPGFANQREFNIGLEALAGVLRRLK